MNRLDAIESDGWDMSSCSKEKASNMLIKEATELAVLDHSV